MRYYRIIIAYFLVVFMVSCSHNSDAEMKLIEDLEKKVMDSQMNNQSETVMYQDSLLILLKSYWIENKQDTASAKMLDKIQMLYSVKGDYINSLKYGDTLLMSFPSYSNRLMVLESQIINLDMFIQPRDTNGMKKYIHMLFKEFPNLNKVKKSEYQFKLQHLGMNFEDLIKYQELND